MLFLCFSDKENAGIPQPPPRGGTAHRRATHVAPSSPARSRPAGPLCGAERRRKRRAWRNGDEEEEGDEEKQGSVSIPIPVLDVPAVISDPGRVGRIRFLISLSTSGIFAQPILLDLHWRLDDGPRWPFSSTFFPIIP